jgi:2,3-bisphosphoglycerate-independent phosphoglycerate mutase
MRVADAVRHSGPARVFMTILCGAGDRPIARLAGRTPLEHAATPHLDKLARDGTLGAITVIGDDITPESDSGAMALLGYDPLEHYTGRGPLEGLGTGFWDPCGSSAAFRINFASQDQRSGRLDRRTARDLSDSELQRLAREMRERVHLADSPGIDFQMIAFGRHRGILGFTSRSVELSGNVTNTDPGFRKVGPFGVPNPSHAAAPNLCEPLDDSEAAANTASAVNEFARASAAVLGASGVNHRRTAAGKLPANVILFRDGGHELPRLEPFGDRTGLTLALYGQVPAEHGLCKLIGGRFVESHAAPGQSDDEYYCELARTLPDDPAGLIFVHLKGADEPGHDNQPDAKAAALESIDRHYFGELLPRLRPDDVVVVTGDHATPCEYGIHATDPVPTLVRGRGVPTDATRSFSEAEAAHGDLPVSRAADLLAWVAGARPADSAAARTAR